MDEEDKGRNERHKIFRKETWMRKTEDIKISLIHGLAIEKGSKRMRGKEWL